MHKNKSGGTRSKDIVMVGVLLGLNILFLWLASMGVARSANLYIAVMMPFPLMLREKRGLAWLLWLGTVLLGIFLLPQRGVALAYGLLGYYLMLRNALDRRVGRIPSLVLKTLWLLLSVVASFWASATLLGMDPLAVLHRAWAGPIFVLAAGLVGSGVAVAFTEWALSAATPMVRRWMGIRLE